MPHRRSELNKGFNLLYSHVMLLSLGFKQGTRFWSQELWKLYLGISHSSRPLDLKLAYRLEVCSEKWGMERQRKMIPDKAAFSQNLPPNMRSFMDFLLFSTRFRTDVKWTKIIRRKSFNAISVGFVFFAKPYPSHMTFCVIAQLHEGKPNPN